MKHIFIRELQDLLKDNRIWIFLLVILLITVCSGIISSLNFRAINSQNQFLIQNYEDEMDESCKNSLLSVSFTNHLALRPINPDMFLTGDIASRYPNHTEVELAMSFFGSSTLHIPQKAISSSISSLPFIRYDLLFIVEVLFSFMIIAYNSISKEKENKTLALALSNSISRTAILTGKMLAYSIIAMISLVLAVIVQLLVIVLMHIIPVDASILSSIGYFLLLSFLYRRIIESIHNKSQHEFVENVRLFRKNLMQTIIELDNQDSKSFHLYFLPNYMSRKPVSRDLIPTFVEVNRTHANRIHQNSYFIFLFLGEILLLFVLGQFIFSKSDVR